MPCRAAVCGPRALCGGFILSSIGFCVLTLTASFVVPAKISDEIKRRVGASVQISSQEKFFDKLGHQDNEAVITVFNLTNAKAVLDGTEKPNFSPIKLGFDVHTERYDPVFVKGGSAVEYKSWKKYTVKAADKDLYEKAMLVVPNAQYIAGVYQRFGSEGTMKIAMIGFVVSKIKEAYSSAVPVLFQFKALPKYLNNISKSLVDQGVLKSHDEVVLQWAFSNQTQVRGFEMDRQPSGIPDSKRLTMTEASKLWTLLADGNATANFIAWYACAAPLAIKKSDFSQCAKAGGEKIIGIFSSDASLAAEKMAFLLWWLISLLSSQAYLEFFKAKVVPTVTAAQLAANFSEVGLLQFGSGEISKAMFNTTSVDGLGILPNQLKGPLELPAYADAALPPLNISQARAFLDVFSVRENVVTFLMAAAQKKYLNNSAAMAKIMPRYQKTGVNSQTDISYARYLHKHLVERVIVLGLIKGGGPMDADGVYPSNSGMFCRLSPKQILEGWTDPLISQVAKKPYYGILGEQFASKEAKDAKKGEAPEYGMSTGVGSASGRIMLWKGITKFHRRDQLPEGSCNDTYTTHVRGDGPNCTAWTREEVIAGSGSGAFLEPFDGEITHSTFKSATTSSATARIWNGDLFRNIEITRTGTMISRGVHLDHYSLSEKTWLGGNCSAGGECNRANYHMTEGDAMYPLETVKKGIPLALSMPYFLTPRGPRSDIRRCMKDSFPRTYKEEEHGMYWRYEPLSGAIAEAGSVRQVNLQVKKGTFAELYPKVFTAMGCDDAFFPLAIAEARKTISGSLRDDILYAYRVVVIGYAVSIACYAVSAISLVVAAILAIHLMRSEGKGQQQESKTDTNASRVEESLGNAGSSRV